MLESFTLPVDEAIAEARRNGGRHTRALLKTPEVRLMLVGMAAGHEWAEHQASGRVIVRVERGRIEFSTREMTRQLSAGELAGVEPHAVHSVRALEDAALLLIVAGPAAAGR